MAHRIIIGKHEQYGTSEPKPKVLLNFDWEPNDSDTLEQQTVQYKKMLRLYLKALHVADPDNHPDPGD